MAFLSLSFVGVAASSSAVLGVVASISVESSDGFTSEKKDRAVSDR